MNKYKTIIGEHAFIGSNTALVAPVTVGAEALVGAGSVITKDVPDGDLAVARGKKLYDKRASMKERDTRREIDRALKERSR